MNSLKLVREVFESHWTWMTRVSIATPKEAGNAMAVVTALLTIATVIHARDEGALSILLEKKE